MFGKNKKKKNCQIGESCGATCIEQSKVCDRDFPKVVEKFVEFMSKKRYLTAKGRAKAEEARRAKFNAEIDAYDNEMKLLTGKTLLKFKQAQNIYNDAKFTLTDKDPVYGPSKQAIERAKIRIKEAEIQMREASRKYKELEDEVNAKYDKEIVEASFRRKLEEKWEDHPKIERIVDDLGIKREQAMGIAAWIEEADYEDVNRYLYDKELVSPDRWKEMEFYNKSIQDNIDKYHRANPDKMGELFQNRKKGFVNKSYEDVHLEDARLAQRGLSLPNPTAFVQRYRDNIGGTIKEPTNFAATKLKDLDFINDGNIIYNIKMKDNTDGRVVDQYKNYAYEGEVFWAAGQNFRVNGVREENGKYYIDLEEE